MTCLHILKTLTIKVHVVTVMKVKVTKYIHHVGYQQYEQKNILLSVV